ncbi:MAG: response regulator [Gomphosphaeria aponina SAG 52.96 = DSM 107014]|uniref:Protein PatA n=1 Tax=Gomphosphaeria aponina SAG 52.96 = DSM 107014 TaxID=1521640 RepID=A0A941GT96_9CHRO|nr:response regulator [Gomphosphaeria aponina SAG 52.96 = DSM 107014]
MFQGSTAVMEAKQKPTDILEKLAGSLADGCLKVSQGSVNYLIYFKQGKLTYATHSIDPFERLERHLRRLSNQNSNLTSAVRTQGRLNFENEPTKPEKIPPEYKSICWLVGEKYINQREAEDLVKSLSKEVLENYLLLPESAYTLVANDVYYTIFCHFNVGMIVEECKKALQGWQALGPEICSPYQRPFCANLAQLKQKLPPEQQNKFSKILIGFSFRQLGVLLNQDELSLAQSLQPLIAEGTIGLRDPQSPFDQLPKLSNKLTEQEPKPKIEVKTEVKRDFGNVSNKIETATPQSKYKIACVDDSPTILKEMKRFLVGHEVEVFPITDSVKALMEIIRIKPDLILLDVGMPKVDGYKLCRMIRNHSLFKTTPIVMVTGNTGMVDRAKAKMAGCTDYMTKPFSQPELLKMVFRYLT